MKKGALLLLILLFTQIFLPDFSYADYLQLPDGSLDPVLMAFFDNDKYLPYAAKSVIKRAIDEGSALMVRSGTRCVEIEQDVKQIMLSRRAVSQVILVEGEHKGNSGWVLSTDVKYESNTSGYFDSGDTVVMMKNGKVIRGYLGKMTQEGISINLFEGASDIFIKKDNILQIESTDKGFGYL
jgi:hypothetical protein